MTERRRGRAGQTDRARRLDLYPLCRRCDEQGITTATEIINHKVPLAPPFNGPDTDANCEGLCIPCHVIVTAEQFGYRRKVAIDAVGWPVE